jgi:hypothetical protein
MGKYRTPSNLQAVLLIDADTVPSASQRMTRRAQSRHPLVQRSVLRHRMKVVPVRVHDNVLLTRGVLFASTFEAGATARDECACKFLLASILLAAVAPSGIVLA